MKQASILNEEAIALQELKNKDTDNDGLDDYSELYFYNTSPYLADSDSDGFSDKEEIESQSDPNCPEGKECLEPRAVNANSNSALGLTSPGEISTDDLALLRESLANAGVPQSMLDEIDDIQLQQMYVDSLADEQAASSTASANSTDPYADLIAEEQNPYGQIYNISDLENLSSEQIREMLIASGVDKSSLDQIDDDTLKAVYNEALAEEGVGSKNLQQAIGVDQNIINE